MAKKTFKDSINPAMSFISQESIDRAEGETPATADAKKPDKAPEGYKLNPEFIEVKSKRVQLLLQPSIVEALKALAKEKGLSMNETANEAIKEYLEREGKL